MSQDVDGYTAQKVEVLSSLAVIKTRTVAMIQHNLVTIEHRQIVAVIGRKNLLTGSVHSSFLLRQNQSRVTCVPIP